jgi:protein subunit release factor B
MSGIFTYVKGAIMREKLFSVTLKDCDVQFYKGSGAGGQKRNKTSSAVRIVHRASGAVGACESHREQSKNKAEAFKRMSQTDKFKRWMHIESVRATGQLAIIEQAVEYELQKNTKIEVKDENGNWVNG